MGFDVRGLLEKHGKVEEVEAFKPPEKKKRYGSGPIVQEPTEEEAKEALYFVNLHGIKTGRKKDLPRGHSGEWHQLTQKIGAKVYYQHPFDTKEEAEASNLFTNYAPEEFRRLKKGRELFGRLAPLALGFGAIKFDGGWRVAILLQHIDGTRLSELDKNKYNISKLQAEPNEKAAKLGYQIHSCTLDNLLLVEDEHESFVYVVDWGCGISRKGGGYGSI